ncbi:alpha/beta fold hydrolase [Motiliproteus sp. SC1-56]|uniref:alpha/beta fold hydrolase n=1 Tax=Motiliproteus sp. SC1-56 TaxID=2799565 RepID=UPI001A8F38D5|nr:alpha/beta hydrolase [Motiliproteus sp. SC1-56]
MRTESFLALNPQGFHRVVYREWGARENERVLVCVHGLVRNSRDFDEVARALSRDYRVVCPDVVGRGDSDWLPPGATYQVQQYVSDMTALLARLNVEKVDWLGTSMGGMIGMAMAALPGSPIEHLVLNDVGPSISRAALKRIGEYVGRAPLFQDHAEVEAYLRSVYPAFDGIEPRLWQQLARHASRETEDGKLALAYDPAIGEHLRQAADEAVELWDLWEQVSCPQLLFWGEESDVLSAETVARMQATRPDSLTLSAWPGIGHPPSLMEPAQIKVLVEWLRTQRAA